MNGWKLSEVLECKKKNNKVERLNRKTLIENENILKLKTSDLILLSLKNINIRI